MVLFTGCSSNNTGKIEGTAWRSLAVAGDLFDEGEEAPAGAVKIQFTKGGTVYLRGPVGQFQGTYTLDSGDWVTLHLDRELDGKKTHRERVMINGNRMTMIGRGGVSVTFEAD
jgi:hypothetical protein